MMKFELNKVDELAETIRHIEAQIERLQPLLEQARALHATTCETEKSNVIPLRSKKECPPHHWDRLGERCINCGQKDWM